MAVSLVPLVDNSFCRIQCRLCRWPSGLEIVGGVMIMLKHLMYPKAGFWLLHAVAVTLLFLLGYSIHFHFH